jgi:hypothetical protein
MHGTEPVQDDEWLLRRVPPWGNPVKEVDGEIKPVRTAFQPGPASLSRMSITSPRELLDALSPELKDKGTWRVALVRAGTIRRLGFEVVPDPVDDGDRGHCHVGAPQGQELDDHDWRALAESSRLLTPDEVASGQLDLSKCEGM